MFGLLNRTTSSASSHRSKPSTDSTPSSPPPPRNRTSPPVSFQPAIDGPPSPEHIRAYTEQMRKGSVFTTRTRSHTSSSATPSFRSGSSEAGLSTAEVPSLSRQSSRRSIASSMALSKADRPDSIQIFGKNLFSRSSRKSRYGSRSSSSLSTMIGESQSAKDVYYERKKGSRRGTFSASASSLDESMKQNISVPYNFQHLTHTRHEQLPNLARASRMELVSEFSAIRASQAPTHGYLKGIKADDLHFKNFSSEALNSSDADSRPRTSPHQPESNPKEESINLESMRKLTRTKSYESIRATPPRPPRSPVTLPCPPPRTSSRNSLMLAGDFDPLASTSLQRPDIGIAFRRPKAFHLPISPQRVITRSDQSEDRILHRTISPPRTPDIDSWPLASPFEGLQLADVPEEDENRLPSRRSRMSSASGELRISKSVPNFTPPRVMAIENTTYQRPLTPPSRAIEHGRSSEIGVALSPTQPIIELPYETWEDDIDYCYEHEAEADCDYEWERSSLIENAENLNGRDETASVNVSPLSARNASSRNVDTRRFQPSLIVPSASDFPELSPMSSDSIESPELRTPGLLRPSHLRSSSHASSFKESHGFSLSPSLLIPADFASHMDQDALYNELLYSNQENHHDLHVQPQFEPYPVSPIDGPSSTASYRSSGVSRASGSVTALSKSGSQESVVLISRAANVALAHRSVSSTASLPELVHSSRSKRNTQELESAPAPDFPTTPLLRRKTSMGLVADQMDMSALSPVAESFKDSGAAPPPPLPAVPAGPAHGRKVSAPLAGRSEKAVDTAPKGRKRAMSARSRSYSIFPQI